MKYEDIYTEGITKITSADFKYAKAMNKSIKLLAMSKDEGDGYVALVAPCMISQEHPLFCVSDVFNAVFVHGNMLGDAMFYGRGAGKLATASAVVADVVECARYLGETVTCLWDDEAVSLKDYKDSAKKFFVRVKNEGADQAATLFGYIEKIEVVDGEFGFVTEVMTHLRGSPDQEDLPFRQELHRSHILLP